MMRLAATALAVVLAIGTAHAADRMKLKGFPGIDAKRGYVFVRVGPTFDEKQKAPNLYLWRYDPPRSELRFRRKKDVNPVVKPEDDRAWVGDRPFMPSPTASGFLVALTPGEWVIHGPESTCLCLGSYAFTVKPRVVTDIGTVTIAQDTDLTEDIRGREWLIGSTVEVRPATDQDPVPDVLRDKIVRATLLSDARFPNRGSTRATYNGGLLLGRASGLPALVPGDGAAMVAAVKAAKDEAEIKAAPIAPPDDKKETVKATPAA